MPVRKMSASEAELLRADLVTVQTINLERVRIRYIWVIPSNEPTAIYFSAMIANDMNMDGRFMLCSDTTRTINMMHHDNLVAKSQSIECGGELICGRTGFIINNRSGHYVPHEMCLAAAADVFKMYGIDVTSESF